jgi:peptidoglycan/LPS O-acetylase OafA/YrhL
MASSVRRGRFTAFLGVLLCAMAVRWLITPLNHPDASTLRTVAVYLQLLLGVVMVVAGYREDRKHRAGAADV